MERQPNTQYVLSISYGKDSLACLGAIEKLELPLDRIVHAEVWATKDIPADLPPMVEFKKKADRIIKERWGIEVEHFRADSTYEQVFHFQYQKSKKHPRGTIYGFPIPKGAWCNSYLKMIAINKAQESGGNSVQYIGIATDELKRLERLDGITKISPLHLIGWTEADCMKWCIENDLRSPTYDDSNRGGCWFCHNQTINQLRTLKHQYPCLWEILKEWDNESPTTFKSDGHTVHDYDARFQLEDEGFVNPDERWKWSYLKNPPCPQINLFESI